MSTINERIARVVSESKLSKTAFAEKIKVSQQYISKLCRSGTPSDRTITDICREFNINETWLRTGDEEMRDNKENTTVEQLCAELHASELESAILRAYFRIDQKIREPFMQKLLHEIQAEYPSISGTGGDIPVAPVFAPEHTPTMEEEARAEAGLHTQFLYAQILSEKKAAAGMSSESSAPEDGDGMAKQA